MGEQKLVILSIAKMPKRYQDRVVFSVRFRWPDEAKENYQKDWTIKGYALLHSTTFATF